jgi:hypothetical protein
MWPVARPRFDAGDTFAICVSQIKNAILRRRLIAIRSNIEVAADDYAQKAEVGELYQVAQLRTIGVVPGVELVKTYDNRMAKRGQPGRPIYDDIKLLPKGDRCPFCDNRNISTLDHILPKKRYPLFAVTPINLVAACADCNKVKGEFAPTTARETVLHPYFEDLSGQQWLSAEVVRQRPPALIYRTIYVDEWDEVINARIAHQFALFGLAKLYSSHAAREIGDIRHNLQRHFEFGAAAAVKAELLRQWESRKANSLNSWQTAAYSALAESEWFCSGGFAED